MSVFPLPWHYLGACDCLLYPSSDHSKDLLKLSAELCAALADDSFPLEDALQGALGDDGESLLFRPIRRVVEKAHATLSRSNGDEARVVRLMKWGPPGRLAGLRVVPFIPRPKMDGRPREEDPTESVLTPNTFYLPWPWFSGFRDAGANRDNARKVFDRGRGLVEDFKPFITRGPYMAFQSVLSAADEVSQCRSPAQHQSMNVENEIKNGARRRRRPNATYEPGPFTAEKDFDRKRAQTQVELQSGKLHVRLGLKPNLESADEKALLGMQLARYPCGSIDGGSGPCP